MESGEYETGPAEMPPDVILAVTIVECPEHPKEEWHAIASGRQGEDKGEMAAALRRVADDLEQAGREEKARLN